MPIRKYAGEPLPEGAIICRESIFHDGFPTRPLVVKKETTHTLVVSPLDDLALEKTVYKRNIAFVCDTAEEGNRLAQASAAFTADEMERSRIYHAEKAARRRAAITAALGDENASQESSSGEGHSHQP